MRIITKIRKQKAVHWKRLAPDQWGRFIYAEPVEVDCRWDDVMKEFRNAQGEVHTSQATVYTEHGADVGDMLMKGELESDTPEDPREAGAFEVAATEEIPTLKANAFLRMAHLGRKIV